MTVRVRWIANVPGHEGVTWVALGDVGAYIVDAAEVAERHPGVPAGPVLRTMLAELLSAGPDV